MRVGTPEGGEARDEFLAPRQLPRWGGVLFLAMDDEHCEQ